MNAFTYHISVTSDHVDNKMFHCHIHTADLNVLENPVDLPVGGNKPVILVVGPNQRSSF